MYAVLVEIANTSMAYSSSLQPSDTASAGTSGMLGCLVGACAFVIIAVYMYEQIVNNIISVSSYFVDDGTMMSPLSSLVGYMCYGILSVWHDYRVICFDSSYTVC
jgi:hypothetical protein